MYSKSQSYCLIIFALVISILILNPNLSNAGEKFETISFSSHLFHNDVNAKSYVKVRLVSSASRRNHQERKIKAGMLLEFYLINDAGKNYIYSIPVDLVNLDFEQGVNTIYRSKNLEISLNDTGELRICKDKLRHTVLLTKRETDDLKLSLKKGVRTYLRLNEKWNNLVDAW